MRNTRRILHKSDLGSWLRCTVTATFAARRTRVPKRVVQLVEKKIESFCLDRRPRDHGSPDRDGSIRVVQHRG
jgi:hypothetical protein